MRAMLLILMSILTLIGTKLNAMDSYRCLTKDDGTYIFIEGVWHKVPTTPGLSMTLCTGRAALEKADDEQQDLKKSGDKEKDPQEASGQAKKVVMVSDNFRKLQKQIKETTDYWGELFFEPVVMSVEELQPVIDNIDSFSGLNLTFGSQAALHLFANSLKSNRILKRLAITFTRDLSAVVIDAISTLSERMTNTDLEKFQLKMKEFNISMLVNIIHDVNNSSIALKNVILEGGGIDDDAASFMTKCIDLKITKNLTLELGVKFAQELPKFSALNFPKYERTREFLIISFDEMPKARMGTMRKSLNKPR